MRLFVTLALLVAAACAHNPAGPGDGPLVLLVDVARPLIRIGDTTTVSVRLRNRHPRPVTMWIGDCSLLPYITAQPSGEIVYPRGSLVCTLGLRRITLGPWGEERMQVRVVGGGGVGPGAVGLPRGAYLVHATFAGDRALQAEPAALAVE